MTGPTLLSGLAWLSRKIFSASADAIFLGRLQGSARSHSVDWRVRLTGQSGDDSWSGLPPGRPVPIAGFRRAGFASCSDHANSKSKQHK
jgi:hypothetical protein